MQVSYLIHTFNLQGYMMKIQLVHPKPMQRPPHTTSPTMSLASSHMSPIHCMPPGTNSHMSPVNMSPASHMSPIQRQGSPQPNIHEAPGSKLEAQKSDDGEENHDIGPTRASN